MPRKSTPTQLSVLEKLLLSQAVYEFGSDAWPQVSKLLANHPLISRPKSFSPQSCNVIYLNLMNDAELDSTDEQNLNKRASMHLKLAQIHYQARVLELQQLILTEESAFKGVLTEIDEIKAGLWDDKIKVELGVAEPDSVSQHGASPTPRNVSTVEDDIAESSQLTSIDAMDESLDPSPLDGQQQKDISTHDLEEDEVSMQLAPAPSSPVPSEGQGAEKSLVPMYTDRESSPPEDIVETLDTPAVDIASPPQESPQPIEEVVPEVHEVPELQPPTSPAGSEEPLSIAAQRRGKDENREETPSEEAVPPEHEDSPMSEAAETPPSEHTTESPKPDSGMQTRRGKRKADAEVESKREKKKVREESEPGEEEEPAPTARKRRTQAQTADSRRFQNLIGLVHSQISQHRNGNIFHNPIKPSEAPDYHDIVKRPMDLKTIKTRIKDGLCTNSLEYQRDVYLMFVNSMMYNRPDSDIYTMAEEMMLESEKHINTFRQTESWKNR